jgi:4-hydroxy-2-oxoheptanedioate aldolase
MRENTAKAKWKAGQVTVGGWLSVPSSVSAEIMAHQGFDWVNIDMQHGLIDYQVAVTMLQAISQTPTIPFVRVPWNEFGIIGKMLDAGAYGVIIPMVNSVEEAKAAVAACRYFPQGSRSFGPARAATYAGADYFAHANEEIAVIPMIETKQAVERLDDILAVPGIDAVYVGPADLSITLGLPPGMDNGSPFEEARIAIAEACKRHGVTAGIHASAALAAKHAAAGYQMITVSSDSGSIAAGAARDLKTVRDQAPQGQPVYR